MWDALIAWFGSTAGARVLQTAIVPALAILVAGVLAALIARAAMRAVIRRSERAEASAVIGALVAVARAAADPEADAAARRRAARLRAEADVRTRLLPLQGAAAAADWATGRIDAIQQHAAEASVSGELDELRDRLVDWVRRPARAKRIFAAPAPVPARAQKAERVADDRRAEPAEGPQADDGAPEAAEPVRPPAAASSTPSRDPEVSASSADVPETSSGAGTADAHPAPAVAVTAEVPAWQRTRAGGRLQQEHIRSRAGEAPTGEDEPAAAAPVPESTAPVQLPHAHRAPEPLTADEAARLEAHQQARHARAGQGAPGSMPSPAATGAVAVVPTPAAPPAPVIPAWLDTYDDEAQVTQNLDLKTPPPVSASSVRDRGTPGEDLVPRS